MWYGFISSIPYRELYGLRLRIIGPSFLQSRKDHNAQDIAKGLIVHLCPSIRIAALNLVANPSVSSGSFSINILEALQEVLPHFHTETNPKIRSEYLVIMKSSFVQIRRGFHYLFEANLMTKLFANESTKDNLQTRQSDTDNICRNQAHREKHAAFLNWFDEFLINELQPCASYQRHITALKAMYFTGLPIRCKSGAFILFGDNRNDSEAHGTAREYSLGFWVIRLLLDLVMDPFDDVRSAAASILNIIFSNVDPTSSFFDHDIIMKVKNNSGSNFPIPIRRTLKDMFALAINRAKATISCTGRADHADGFGRLCQLNFDFYELINNSKATSDKYSVLNNLLSSLSASIVNARDNLSLAIANSSLHGNLIAVRYFISKSSASFTSTNPSK